MAVLCSAALPGGPAVPPAPLCTEPAQSGCWNKSLLGLPLAGCGPGFNRKTHLKKNKKPLRLKKQLDLKTNVGGRQNKPNGSFKPVLGPVWLQSSGLSNVDPF